MFCLLALSIQPAPGYNLGHLTSKSGMQVKHDLPPYGLILKFPKCLNNLSMYEALLNLSAYHYHLLVFHFDFFKSLYLWFSIQCFHFCRYFS